MIAQLTVDEISEQPGFEAMVQEYGQLAGSILPPGTYSKEEYKPIEDAGLLAVYGALDGGKIVGFAACIKARLPHYGIFAAIVESLYLMRGHRSKGYGNQLIDACEDYARIKALNPIFIQVHEEELERLGVILDRRKYSVCIHTYGRLL